MRVVDSTMGDVPRGSLACGDVFTDEDGDIGMAVGDGKAVWLGGDNVRAGTLFILEEGDGPVSVVDAELHIR